MRNYARETITRSFSIADSAAVSCECRSSYDGMQRRNEFVVTAARDRD